MRSVPTDSSDSSGAPCARRVVPRTRTWWSRASTIVPAVLVAAWALPAAAGERLRLDDVLAEARQANPQIVAARERAHAAAAVPRRVSGLEDPTFSWESWNSPDAFRPDRADNNIFRLAQ